MKRLLLPMLLAVSPLAAAAGHATLDLRYRYERVEQDDKPLTAEANTLRLRLRLETGEFRGFSALTEFDHVEGIGDEHYDDTRNGRTNYPVVADPEGTDLNQAYIQYKAPRDTTLRVGRQKIALEKERYIGPVGWRHNEQTFEAFRVETKAIPGALVNYFYIDRVRRVFGPDPGTPPPSLDSDSHALTAKLTSLPVGTLSLYGFHLEFDDAPQLSSATYGARYEGTRPLAGEWNWSWALEYAHQADAGANAADIDAHYEVVELGLRGPVVGFTAAREVLSGERGAFTATTNPAFQTPLATLHPWQGWADKFLTTPSAGIEDLYFGTSVKFRGWTGQAVWHDFGAEATGADYGDELDVSLARKFAERYEVLVKYADFDGKAPFADTTKFWFQLGASF